MTSVYIWIVWASISIDVSSDSTLAANNAAVNLDHSTGSAKWPTVNGNSIGGGNALGTTSVVDNSDITYGYALGKMQATATLSPAGVENVLPAGVLTMRRNRMTVGWDNAGHYIGDTWQDGPIIQEDSWTDDSGSAGWQDVDPTNSGHLGKIYDVDFPACPIVSDVLHETSECYDNFEEYVTLSMANTSVQCSEFAYWSYKAGVDSEGESGGIVMNSLSTSVLTLPTEPFFAKR